MRRSTIGIMSQRELPTRDLYRVWLQEAYMNDGKCPSEYNAEGIVSIIGAYRYHAKRGIGILVHQLF